jgi:hypothetical protein
VLLAAPLLSDLLWPIFLLVGWEVVRIDPNGPKLAPFDFVSYPWSHSLLMCLAIDVHGGCSRPWPTTHFDGKSSTRSCGAATCDACDR